MNPSRIADAINLGADGPGVEQQRDYAGEAVIRRPGEDRPPRRRDDTDDDDPVMPTDDASLAIKI